MFLRHKLRRKDGKEHRYWSIVENRRVSGGRTVQRHVLYLGEINDSQRAAWWRTIEAFDEDGQASRQIALFPEDRAAPSLDCDVVQVRLSGLQLRRPRQWGACWLACHLWEQLLLDDFWSPRLVASRQGTRWLNVLKTLVAYRLIDPGSEWRLHRQWYEQSAMADLLGEDFALAHKDTLYRCLDKLLAHKTELFSFLRQRWETLFQAGFEVLLYDLTSTYFECDPPEAGKRRFGYSRDKRSDCVQVVIALIVTPAGFPLAYEVMAGNTADKTTLRDFIRRIEAQYGKAERTWVMDRGIPTEDVLAEMRAAETPVYYLVGTPRGRLSQLEQGFLAKPWAQVRDSVQVKLVEQDGELYILARSGARRDKEQAMRRRRLKKLIKRLHELRQQKLTRDQLLIKLGAARKEAGPAAWRIIDLQLPDKDQAVSAGDVRLSPELAEIARGASPGRQLPVAVECDGQRSSATLGVLLAVGRGGAGVQGTQGRPGDPPDLPPNRRAYRSAHLCGVPRLLPAGDAQAAAALPGARTDAEVGAGEDGGDPDGRCAPADDGWPYHRAVALHRTRSGSGDPAATVEADLARPAAPQDHRGGGSRISMIGHRVVPTLAGAAVKNQPLGRFSALGSERRANVV